MVVIERPQPWKNLAQPQPKSKLPPGLSDAIRLNAEKLADAIGRNGGPVTEIAVLRQGKIVSLSLPSAVTSLLIASRK
jgi:hypothetical protein